MRKEKETRGRKKRQEEREIERETVNKIEKESE